MVESLHLFTTFPKLCQSFLSFFIFACSICAWFVPSLKLKIYVQHLVCWCCCMNHGYLGRAKLSGEGVGEMESGILINGDHPTPLPPISMPENWVTPAKQYRLYHLITSLAWAAASSLGGGELQSGGSSDRYCSGAMFHPKFISLAQVVPGPIQPWQCIKVA